MHTEWKNVVLSSYPKILISPEREITGLSTIIERRKEMTKKVYHVARSREKRRDSR